MAERVQQNDMMGDAAVWEILRGRSNGDSALAPADVDRNADGYVDCTWVTAALDRDQMRNVQSGLFTAGLVSKLRQDRCAEIEVADPLRGGPLSAPIQAIVTAIWQQLDPTLPLYTILPADGAWGSHVKPFAQQVFFAMEDTVVTDVETWLRLLWTAGHEAAHPLIETRGDYILHVLEEQLLCDTFSLLNLLRNPIAAEWFSEDPARIDRFALQSGHKGPVRMQLIREILNAALRHRDAVNGKPTPCDRREAVYTALARALPEFAKARTDLYAKKYIDSALKRLFPDATPRR